MQTNFRDSIGKSNYIELHEVDPDTLTRITNNYIRHELTNYDEILESIKGKVGISEGYIKLKENVLMKKIQEVYPSYF